MVNIETYYLIDYENVHGDGLSGCQNLKETDHIIIFYTQNARSIDMSTIDNIGRATMRMKLVPAGKQSADMHIGSYFGYLAGMHGKDCKVVIISKDTDFDNVIKFWKDEIGITASRKDQIKPTPAKTSTKKQPAATPKKATKAETKAATKTASKANSSKKTKLNQEVMKAVRNAGFDATVANNVAQMVSGSYGHEHQLSEVHNALRERYLKYLELYAAIKPVVSKYSGDGQAKNGAAQITAQDKTALNSELQKILSKAGFNNEIISFVSSTAVKNLGEKNAKQLTYRAIISKYGQNQGLAIYNHIKKNI